MSILDYIENVNGWDKRQVYEALYWIVLGDGYLARWNSSHKNCFLNVSHKQEQREYLIWKAAILSRANIGWNVGTSDRSLEGKGIMVYLNSKCHPLFRQIADRIYVPIGRKSLDTHALALLDKIGLAILYQDDGTYNKSKYSIRITKTSFSSVEMEAIVKVVVEKFGIIFRLQRHAGGYDLGLRYSDKDKFFDLIEPYVVPTMRYKLGRGDTSYEVKR